MNDYRYAHLEFELGGLGLESVKELEVFRQGYDTAMNHEKMDVYKANLWANQYCAEDIDAALAEYPDNPTRAYAQVSEIYGNERIATVLNISIEAREQMPSYDNFSRETRDWGEQYKITGATAPKYLLPLESNKRPPLLITDTATLESFAEVVRANEIAHERKQQVQLGENAGWLRAETPEPFQDLITTAAVPQTSEVVKIMAVREIVAKMPTPELMAMVEQQLMARGIDELQVVYPHVFAHAEPERSARAERIVTEIRARSPIANVDYPDVFNEVFNQKIAEPILNYDLSMPAVELRAFSDIIADINNAFGMSLDAESEKNVVLFETYQGGDSSLLKGFESDSRLIGELKSWIDNIENKIVRTQDEFDSVPQDFEGRIVIRGGEQAEPIKVVAETAFVAGDSNVVAYNSTVFAYDDSVISATLSTVTANDNAQVFSYESAVTLNGNAALTGDTARLIDNRTSHAAAIDVAVQSEISKPKSPTFKEHLAAKAAQAKSHESAKEAPNKPKDRNEIS
jgi:hypothetical protein